MSDTNTLKHYGIKGMRWGVLRDPGADGLVGGGGIGLPDDAKKLLKNAASRHKNQDPERAAAIEKGTKVREENQARMIADSAARLAEAQGASAASGKKGSGGKKKKETDAEEAAKTPPEEHSPAAKVEKQVSTAKEALADTTIAEAQSSSSDSLGRKTLDLFMSAYGKTKLVVYAKHYSLHKN